MVLSPKYRFPHSLAVAILLLFALANGIVAAQVQMPLNGWDEYQHIAAAVHRAIHDQMPEQGSLVPRDMINFLLSHPHPEKSAQQLGNIQAQTYKEFTGAGGNQNGSLPILYQAQQGPLFYIFAARIIEYFRIDSLLQSVDVLELLNIILFSLTTIIWYAVCFAIMRNRFIAFTSSALFAAFPLTAYNFARVGNDGLALFFGMLSLLLFFSCVTARESNSKGFTASCTVGISVGLGVIAKATIFPLFMGLIATFCIHAYRERKYYYFIGLLLFILGYAATTYSYHYYWLTTTGQIVGLQASESVSILRVDKLVPYLTTILHPRHLYSIFFYGTPFLGGWTLMPAPKPINIAYAALLLTALIAFVKSFGFPTSTTRQERLQRYMDLLIIIAIIWAGVAYKDLKGFLAWGRSVTLPWYGMICLPALFAIAIGSLLHIKNQWALVWSLCFAALCTTATIWGALALLHFQTGVDSIVAAYAAVVAHHHYLKTPLSLLWILAAVSHLLMAWGIWRAYLAQHPPTMNDMKP